MDGTRKETMRGALGLSANDGMIPLERTRALASTMNTTYIPMNP